MSIAYLEEPGTRPSYAECVQLMVAVNAIENLCWSNQIPRGPIRVFTAPITTSGHYMTLDALLPPHIAIPKPERRRWRWRRG